jgi:hypothetical protein
VESVSQQPQAIAQSSGWRAALGISAAAVYAPFVLMAIYTLAFISCSHCKAAAWTLVVPGPGIVPMEILRQALNTPRLPDGVSFAIGTVVAFAIIAGLAWLGRLGRGWLIGASIAAFALASGAAFGLLAVIRA